MRKLEIYVSSNFIVSTKIFENEFQRGSIQNWITNKLTCILVFDPITHICTCIMSNNEKKMKESCEIKNKLYDLENMQC